MHARAAEGRGAGRGGAGVGDVVQGAHDLEDGRLAVVKDVALHEDVGAVDVKVVAVAVGPVVADGVHGHGRGVAAELGRAARHVVDVVVGQRDLVARAEEEHGPVVLAVARG